MAQLYPSLFKNVSKKSCIHNRLRKELKHFFKINISFPLVKNIRIKARSGRKTNQEKFEMGDWGSRNRFSDEGYEERLPLLGQHPSLMRQARVRGLRQFAAPPPETFSSVRQNPEQN